MYGSRIEVVRWYFENDETIKASKVEDRDIAPQQKKTLNVKQISRLKRRRSGPEKNDEQEDVNVVKIGGIWYQHFHPDASDNIEKTYQEYLKSPDKPHVTYIEVSEDLYEVKFTKKMQGNWQVLNTAT